MTGDPTRDVVNTLALVTAIARRVTDADKTARTAALGALDVSERLKAKLPDGTIVGTVSVVNGSTKAVVANADELLDWVAANHATELETVTTTRIRPGYVTALLKQAEAHGEPVTRDGETVAGVAIRHGNPYVKVDQTPDQAELVAGAWLRREIALPVLGELPAGDTPTSSESETASS